MSSIAAPQRAFKTNEERKAASAAEAHRDLRPLSGAEQRASLEAVLLHGDHHPTAHWHGVYLVLDERTEGTTILDAALDDVDDFCDHHPGAPATHAWARSLAETELALGSGEITRAAERGYEEWCDDMRRDRDPEGV